VILALFICSLLAFFLQEAIAYSPNNPRAIDALVLCIVLLGVITVNGLIHQREIRLTKLEMCTRIKNLLDDLKDMGLGEKQVIKVHLILAKTQRNALI
jgi:hypothetical protein